MVSSALEMQHSMVETAPFAWEQDYIEYKG